MRLPMPLERDAGADTDTRHTGKGQGTMRTALQETVTDTSAIRGRTDSTKRDARGYPVGRGRMNEGTAPDARNVDARSYHHGERAVTPSGLPPAPAPALGLAPEMLAAPDTIKEGDATGNATLYRMIAARTVPAEDREDCEQTMRAAVWSRRGRPDTLSVIANASAIDYARKYCRVSARGVKRDAMPLQDVGAGAGPSVDPWSDVDARLDGTDTIMALVGAANLATLDLQIIRWRYVDGDSYRDIGERLAMNAGAVRVHLHRAIKTLRDVAGVVA